MKIKSIDSNIIVKNTFLNQAKKATNPQDKNILMSWHYEAKSRLHYNKMNKTIEGLEDLGYFDDLKTLKDWWKFSKIMVKIGYEKYQSWRFYTKAYEVNPQNHNKLTI